MKLVAAFLGRRKNLFPIFLLTIFLTSLQAFSAFSEILTENEIQQRIDAAFETSPSQTAIEELMTNLGAFEYGIREQAQQEIEQRILAKDMEATERVLEARESQDPEVRYRAHEILHCVFRRVSPLLEDDSIFADFIADKVHVHLMRLSRAIQEIFLRDILDETEWLFLEPGTTPVSELSRSLMPRLGLIARSGGMTELLNDVVERMDQLRGLPSGRSEAGLERRNRLMNEMERATKAMLYIAQFGKIPSDFSTERLEQSLFSYLEENVPTSYLQADVVEILGRLGREEAVLRLINMVRSRLMKSGLSELFQEVVSDMEASMTFDEFSRNPASGQFAAETAATSVMDRLIVEAGLMRESQEVDAQRIMTLVSQSSAEVYKRGPFASSLNEENFKSIIYEYGQRHSFWTSLICMNMERAVSLAQGLVWCVKCRTIPEALREVILDTLETLLQEADFMEGYLSLDLSFVVVNEQDLLNRIVEVVYPQDPVSNYGGCGF